MKSPINFLAFVYLSSFRGFVLGTHDKVTTELHEEWKPYLAKDFQILVSGLISNKNGKQKCSHASNGGLFKNKKTMEWLIVIDCFSSKGLKTL